MGLRRGEVRTGQRSFDDEVGLSHPSAAEADFGPSRFQFGQNVLSPGQFGDTNQSPGEALPVPSFWPSVPSAPGAWNAAPAEVPRHANLSRWQRAQVAPLAMRPPPLRHLRRTEPARLPAPDFARRRIPEGPLGLTTLAARPYPLKNRLIHACPAVTEAQTDETCIRRKSKSARAARRQSNFL